jgi:uncharacterized membrane protein YedE/YeeE
VIVLIAGFVGFGFKTGVVDFTATCRELYETGDFFHLAHVMGLLFLTTLAITTIYACDHDPPLFRRVRSFTLSNSPIGLAVALGAAIFGVGMHLASRCGGGTLVGMGAGFFKSWFTIIGYIVGSTIGVIDPVLDWFGALPQWRVVKLHPALSLSIELVLFAVFLAIEVRKLRRDDPPDDFNFSDSSEKDATIARIKDWRVYAWDAALGSAIAVWFLCTGSPVRVLEAFSLVGSYVCKMCGAHPERWKVWGGHLPHPMELDVFVGDVSVVLGSFVAAGTWGHFAQHQEHSVAHAMKAMVGGTLMGISGTIAHGCTMGAMVGGIDSSSLHGWLWMICAFGGSAAAIWADKGITRAITERRQYATVP